MTNTALDTVLHEMGGMIEDISGNIPEGQYINLYNAIMEVRNVAHTQTTELSKVANRAFKNNRELRTRLAQSNYVTADLMKGLATERLISADLSKSLAAERLASTWIIDPETNQVMSTSERLSHSEESASQVPRLKAECDTIRRDNKRLRGNIDRMEIECGRVVNPHTGRMIARNGQTARKLRRI